MKAPELAPPVHRAFAFFDRDHSGFLDARELTKALRHYGLDADTDEARKFLSAYDDTPDGKLDVSEFNHLIRDIEAPLFQATHPGMRERTERGGGRDERGADRGDERDDRDRAGDRDRDRGGERGSSSDKTSGVPASIPEGPPGGERGSPSKTKSFASSRGVDNPPRVLAPERAGAPPPPTPLNGSLRSERGGDAAVPLSAAARGSASSVRPGSARAPVKETAMAIRMRDMANDLSKVLTTTAAENEVLRSSQNSGQNLAAAYRCAVEKRDENSYGPGSCSASLSTGLGASY